MAQVQAVSVAADRVMHALVAGLELEFGRSAAKGLAQHFIDAEECDFLWDARTEERWISTYPALDDPDLELDRVAIMGRLDGGWFVAVCIVDGDGRAHGLVGRRNFLRIQAAQMAFVTQH